MLNVGLRSRLAPIYIFVFASVALGLMSSLLSYDPKWFIISVISVAAMKLPINSSKPSPSYLGLFVYADPTVRLCGNRLNATLPINFAPRMFNLFGTSTSAVLNLAEQVATRIDRVAGTQNPALYTTHSGGEIEELPDEDSYSARQRRLLN